MNTLDWPQRPGQHRRPGLAVRIYMLVSRGGVLPACTADACKSGREPCPTPEACRLPIKSVEPIKSAEQDHPWLWQFYFWGAANAVIWSYVAMVR